MIQFLEIIPRYKLSFQVLLFGRKKDVHNSVHARLASWTSFISSWLEACTSFSSVTGTRFFNSSLLLISQYVVAAVTFISFFGMYCCRIRYYNDRMPLRFGMMHRPAFMSFMLLFDLTYDMSNFCSRVNPGHDCNIPILKEIQCLNKIHWYFNMDMYIYLLLLIIMWVTITNCY